MKKTDLLKLIYFNQQASNTIKRSQNLSFKTQSQNQTIKLNKKKISYFFEFNISWKLKHCRETLPPRNIAGTMEVNPYVHTIWSEESGLKYGCGVIGCLKLFHSLEFVEKHLNSEHPDLMLETKASEILAESLKPYVYKRWIDKCGWMYGCQAEGCMMKLLFHSSEIVHQHLRIDHSDLLTMSELLEGSESSISSAEDTEDKLDRWQERLDSMVHKIWSEKSGLKYGCGARGCIELFHSLEFVERHLNLKHPDLLETEASNSRWQGSDPITTGKEKLAEASEPYVLKMWIEDCGWMYGCQAERCMMKLMFHSSEFVHQHLRREHSDLLTMSEVLEGSESSINSAEDMKYKLDRWQERMKGSVEVEEIEAASPPLLQQRAGAGPGKVWNVKKVELFNTAVGTLGGLDVATPKKVWNLIKDEPEITAEDQARVKNRLTVERRVAKRNN